MNNTDIFYKPKGAALEYGDHALNHYKNCSHGCTYCYSPAASKQTRAVFHAETIMAVNWLARVEKHAAKMEKQGKTGPVHMCFLSDAYQPEELESEATRKVLEIFARHGIQSQILTKAGSWPLDRDAELLQATRARYGATLTLDDDAESLKWEPGTPLPGERIEGLEKAKALGLYTWVSMEPVLDPDAVYRLINRIHPFIDEFKVGKLNHHPFAKTINWVEFRARVIEKLESVGARYMIKHDLKIAA